MVSFVMRSYQAFWQSWTAGFAYAPRWKACTWSNSKGLRACDCAPKGPQPLHRFGRKEQWAWDSSSEKLWRPLKSILVTHHQKALQRCGMFSWRCFFLVCFCSRLPSGFVQEASWMSKEAGRWAITATQSRPSWASTTSGIFEALKRHSIGNMLQVQGGWAYSTNKFHPNQCDFDLL